MTQAIARTQARQELATSGPKDLTIETVCEMTGYEPLQLALIARTVAVGAPLLELAQFAHACKQLGLDPMLRQAYWIRRKNRERGEDGQWRDVWKGTLQVGIDGFRSLADRQGNYAGSEPPTFRGWKEISYEKTVDGRKQTFTVTVPEKAQVICWKIVQGHKAAFTGEAWWDEFYPGPTQGQMWHKMPKHQLAKCAEAQALRKGWPALLGSLDLNEATEPSGYSVYEGELPEVGAPPVEQEASPPPSRSYQQIFGSEETGTAYDLPQTRAAQSSPPARAQSGRAADESASAAPPEGDRQITDKRDPLWRQWLDMERQARIASVDVDASAVHLPITESALQASLDMVREAIADAAPKQEAFEA